MGEHKMHKFPFFPNGLAPLSFALFLTIGTHINAQTTEIDTLRDAANTGSAQAQLLLGETYLYGTEQVAADKVAGLDLIERAASSQFVPAQAVLGKILVDGYYTEADTSKGIALLEAAASAGNPSAQATLGEALLWGQVVDPDPLRAKTLLLGVARAGNTDAMRLLGEQLIGGWVLEQDIPEGLAMLTAAAETGDAKAQVALGKFLLFGDPLEKDTDRALALFEAAADQGNGEGLYHHGALLMWSQNDPNAAEAYLNRSGAMGVPAAWTTLAEGAMYGYLGMKQRRKFEGYAEKALALDEPRIAVLEAQRRLYGINMRASGPIAIQGLEDAATAGNADAATFLIALVRDGNRLNVRKSPDQAARYLAEYANLLTPEEQARLAFTIKVAAARGTRQFQELADEFNSFTDVKNTAFGKDLLKANANFAVFLVQNRLKQQGIYTGPADGMAGKGTIRALGAACPSLRNTARCDDTVMHPDVIGQVLMQ